MPIIISLIISIIFINILANTIFSVDIIYNDKEIVSMLSKELDKYNIKKYQRKRDYEYINKVKKNILNDNKDILEWIEIEESGTKYIVKVVERKKENKLKEYRYQSVIAKKDATIISIKALSGEKSKLVNQYVRKGETIISGIINKSDNTKIYTKAKGTVIGEVWYKINIEYPLYYKEERITGKTKKIITLNFFNYKLPLFLHKKYKQFKSTSSIILESNIIPFKILKEKRYEYIINEHIYTQEEAIQKALEESKKKLLESNKKITNIKNVIILNKQNLNSKIKLNLFISVLEDITDIIEIKEEISTNN